MNLNLNGIRSAVQIFLSGYPARGNVGEARLDDMINLGLQRLWADLPAALTRTEIKFRLQKSITTTVQPDSAHSRVMRLTTATTSANSLLGSSTGNRTEWAGRWIDITDTDGIIHTFRIRSVFRGTADQGGSTFYDYIVIDRPWANVSDTGLTARIYCKEYPFPGDVKSVKSVIIQQANAKPRDLTVLDGEQMFEYLTSSGFDQTGIPEAVALGDFYQLPAPRFAPTVSADGGGTWGAGGSDCEPGGTFKYLVCLGWGVRPRADGIVRIGGSNLAQTTTGQRLPFYISAPCEPSSEISTTWSGSRTLITTPDVSSVFGFPSDASAVDGTVPDSGVKKWIFRARTATTSSGGSSNHDTTPADGVYRLFDVVDGDTESTYDDGSKFPLSDMTLTDFYGHRHLRFDKAPTSDDIMATARVTRKAPKLVHDSDSPGIPADAIEALVFAVATIVANRDAKPQLVQFYEAQYASRLKELRAGYATSGLRDEGFGDGLGMDTYRSELWGATAFRSST